MVAVPARHPLLAHKRIPLDELLRYPLVLCDPQACEGHAKQVERVLRRADVEPLIAERVSSTDLMMALVSAGFALGLAGSAHIAASRDFSEEGFCGQTRDQGDYLPRPVACRPGPGISARPPGGCAQQPDRRCAQYGCCLCE